jgi:hypothetical protein
MIKLSQSDILGGKPYLYRKTISIQKIIEEMNDVKRKSFQ